MLTVNCNKADNNALMYNLYIRGKQYICKPVLSSHTLTIAPENIVKVEGVVNVDSEV